MLLQINIFKKYFNFAHILYNIVYVQNEKKRSLDT